MPPKLPAKRPSQAKLAQSAPAQQKRINFELILTTAWQQQAWWLWLLLPFSGLYSAVAWLRRHLYQHHFLPVYRAPVPVMIVGNISVGGSGKTPLLIALVEYLQAQGVQVGVISRGYGGDETQMPCLVTAASSPNRVGDEPCLIVRQTGVMLSVCPDRQLAIECLLQHAPDTQLIIADDGLQHYQLARDIEWIVVDTLRGFGNKQRLPTGFLREPPSRLQEPGVTVVYHQPSPNPHNVDGVKNADAEDTNGMKGIKETDVVVDFAEDAVADCMADRDDPLTMHLSATALMPLSAVSVMQPPPRQPLTKAQTVYGVSGIGYPQRFFSSLRQLGFVVIEHPMPDHHDFSATDLLSLRQYPIVITTKDAVKIAPLLAQEPALAQLAIWVLPVQAVLSPSCYHTLQRQLQQQGVL